MARPRKPTAILELNGAFKHDPARRRARTNEPKPTCELGNPPIYLSQAEKKIWKELRKIAAPGVLTNADRWTVELAVTLMAKLRAHSIKPAELSLLMTALTRLGMTPADRSKISAVPEPTPKEESWSDFVHDNSERATQ